MKPRFVVIIFLGVVAVGVFCHVTERDRQWGCATDREPDPAREAWMERRLDCEPTEEEKRLTEFMVHATYEEFAEQIETMNVRELFILYSLAADIQEYLGLPDPDRWSMIERGKLACARLPHSGPARRRDLLAVIAQPEASDRIKGKAVYLATHYRDPLTDEDTALLTDAAKSLLQSQAISARRNSFEALWKLLPKNETGDGELKKLLLAEDDLFVRMYSAETAHRTGRRFALLVGAKATAALYGRHPHEGRTPRSFCLLGVARVPEDRLVDWPTFLAFLEAESDRFHYDPRAEGWRYQPHKK